MNVKLVAGKQPNLIGRHTRGSKEYIEHRDIEKVEFIINDDLKYRIEFIRGELVINKTDFVGGNAIQITPHVSNQISIK